MMRTIQKQYGFALSLNKLRAYRTLIKSGEGEIKMWALINKLANDIKLAKLFHFNGLVKAQYKNTLISAIQQKMLQDKLLSDVCPSMMMGCANNKFPLYVVQPEKWRSFYNDHGANIHPLSFIFWAREIINKAREGVSTYRHYMQQSFPDAPSAPYAVLSGLTPNAFFGYNSGDKQPRNMLSWFQSRFGLKHHWIVPIFGQDDVKSGKTIISQHSFPNYEDEIALSSFKTQARQSIFKAFLKLVIGQWQATYMLKDIIEFHYVENMPDKALAQKYTFINSNHTYRPFWTYAAEARGAEVSLIFYSTNTFDYEFRDGSNLGTSPGYETMTWPVIYTKSQEHADFLKKAIKSNPDIYVEGVIPFDDSGESIKIEGCKKVVFFDVQAFRDGFMAKIGRPCHVYNSDVSLQTFDPLLALCHEQSIDLYYKPKRDVGNRISKAYKHMIDRAVDSKTLKVIESSISPETLCEQADAVICQPFTSSALYAQKLGKPVIFFDALGFYKKDQPACQGVKLVQGKAELQDWLEGVFSETQVAA